MVDAFLLVFFVFCLLLDRFLTKHVSFLRRKPTNDLPVTGKAMNLSVVVWRRAIEHSDGDSFAWLALSLVYLSLRLRLLVDGW
jgi:hypothetical protein